MDGNQTFPQDADGPADASPSYGEVLRAWRGEVLPEGLLQARELFRHPRPLGDEERRLVREAAVPVLRDLAVVGLVPDILEESRTDLGPQTITAWILGPIRNSGQELRVWREAAPPERIVQVAEQLQEWARDVQVWELAGRASAQIRLWATWPACPEHDRSHPLVPTVQGHSAVWSCLESEHVIAQIGELDNGGNALLLVTGIPRVSGFTRHMLDVLADRPRLTTAIGRLVAPADILSRARREIAGKLDFAHLTCR